MIGSNNRVQGRPILDVLAKRLAAYGIVSITVDKAGKQTHTVPLLNGHLRLAIEPVHLALKSAPRYYPFSQAPKDGATPRSPSDARSTPIPPVTTRSASMQFCSISQTASRLCPRAGLDNSLGAAS